MAEAAAVLGEPADADEFARLRDRIGDGFRRHYVRDGRVRSDSVTGYALAIAFGLLEGDDRQKAGDRLAELVRAAGHRISTGFAGTPFVNDALATTGHLDDAYALLLQREAPSWLYAVTMGGTTIWERWDSMLPDGSINPGEMTSFNHYAFGAVADWMHRSVAGPRAARARVPPDPRRTSARRRADLGASEPRDSVRPRGCPVGCRGRGHPRADRGARGCRGGGAASRVRGRDRRPRHPRPSDPGSERMTDTHDVALEGGGHDFRVRVYPAAEPNGAMLVWLHGGAFMFGTLEMPEADQVGRRLSAAGVTVVSVDYTLAPLDALESLAAPDPDADFPSPEQLRAEAAAAGPRARFPVALAADRRGLRLGGPQRRPVRRGSRTGGARRCERGRQPLGGRGDAPARSRHGQPQPARARLPLAA